MILFTFRVFRGNRRTEEVYIFKVEGEAGQSGKPSKSILRTAIDEANRFAKFYFIKPDECSQGMKRLRNGIPITKDIFSYEDEDILLEVFDLIATSNGLNLERMTHQYEI